MKIQTIVPNICIIIDTNLTCVSCMIEVRAISLILTPNKKKYSRKSVHIWFDLARYRPLPDISFQIFLGNGPYRTYLFIYGEVPTA